MDSVLLFILITNTIAGLTIAGSLLLKEGYKRNKDGKFKTPFLIAGWICLGLLSLGLIALLSVAIYAYQSVTLVVVLLLSPFILLGGLIACSAIGITLLIKGYQAKNNGKITSGYILLGVVVAIIVSVVLLIVWFSNYFQAHPISFM